MNNELAGIPEMAVEKLPFSALNAVSPKTGINTIKNENFATSSFLTPANNPVAMVDPERDNPGKMATACTIPINKALLQFSGLRFTVCGER